MSNHIRGLCATTIYHPRPEGYDTRPLFKIASFTNDMGFLGIQYEYNFTNNLIQESKEWQEHRAYLEEVRRRFDRFSSMWATTDTGARGLLAGFDLEEAERRLSAYEGAYTQRYGRPSTNVFQQPTRQIDTSFETRPWLLGGAAEVERSALFSALDGWERQAFHQEEERNRRSESAKKFLETNIGKVLYHNGWGDILSRDASAEDIRPSPAFSEYQTRRREQARLSHLRRGKY